MLAVGIKQLRNHLSEYVRKAAAGEVVLVTDRDRVVAELRPPDPTRSPVVADAALAELVRQGVMAPPRRRPGSLTAKPVSLPKGVSLVGDLVTERDSE